MMYLSCRLQKSGHIAPTQFAELLNQLAQEAKLIDPYTWEIWRTTQVIYEDDSRIHLSINSHEHHLKTVIVSSPCYLRLEQNNNRSIFTLVSNDRSALHSIRSLIENIYAPIHNESLDEFIQQNTLTLFVQAIKLYQNNSEYNTDSESSLNFGQPVMLRKFLTPKSSSRLLSFTASVDIKVPYLRVHFLHISSIDNHVGFAVEADSKNENILIDSLFTLADQTFKGRSLDSSFGHKQQG